MLSIDESDGSGESGAALMGDEDHPLAGNEGDARTYQERRRPGRLNHANPSLLPLLRGEASPASELAKDVERCLDPATGIAVSAIISCLIWAAIYYMI
jgi:hypothetical protein